MTRLSEILKRVEVGGARYNTYLETITDSNVDDIQGNKNTQVWNCSMKDKDNRYKGIKVVYSILINNSDVTIFMGFIDLDNPDSVNDLSTLKTSSAKDSVEIVENHSNFFKEFKDSSRIPDVLLFDASSTAVSRVEEIWKKSKSPINVTFYSSNPVIKKLEEFLTTKTHKEYWNIIDKDIDLLECIYDRIS